MSDIIYNINTDNAAAIKNAEDLYTARTIISESVHAMNEFDSDVTILIQGYNRVDKTKECIDSVLKHTNGVKYDLLLIDNGSTDDTLEYFKSIDYPYKRILHLSKNISAMLPANFIDINWISRYLVSLSNDLIVTDNWLSNLVKVAESDPKIGIVNPMSSNVSNLQGYDMEFTDFEDMQKKAAVFNKSDPAKWHERLRIITLGTLYRKECLYAIGMPLNDMGFFHDFADDDIAFRVRRAGYKVILAKDTWIHHNHAVFSGEGKDPAKFAESLRVGRANFRDKYFGVDAWDDVNNFAVEYVSALKNTASRNPRILGIDVKCGTPALEIKNAIRSFGKFNTEVSAFTCDAKYLIDLQTVCGTENVHFGKIDEIGTAFSGEEFDYIVIGENINRYPEPYKIIKAAYSMLKKGGQLFFSLKNAFDIHTFLYVTGNRKIYSKDYSVNYSVEDFYARLLEQNYKADILCAVPYNSSDLPADMIEFAKKQLGNICPKDFEETFFRLIADRFAFSVFKP